IVSAQADTDTQEGFHTITPDEADQLRERIPPADELEELSNLNKLLQDQTRLRILLYIAQQELCVHDLTELLDMNQPAVSHQLGKLQEQGLLERRKEGRVVYYSPQNRAGITLIEKGLEILKDA
ncbi:MAG: ArsR/SmtB family transcription factor, partial [bacterium]